jgi:hypothetical protein
MKKLLVLTLLFCSFLLAHGQIEFEKTSHDFGQIKEIDGPVEITYKFINKGTTPVQIKNVKASCGCTTPDWSREQIPAGGTGYVRASFNPHNRPGAFTKTVTVFSTVDSLGANLTFHGFVIAKQKTLNENFPAKAGDLRFESTTVNFDRITTKGPVEKTIKVYNDGKESVSFSKDKSVPSHLSAELPDKVDAGKTAEIKLTYNPSKKNEFGPVKDEFTISTGGPENSKITFTVEAEIVEYFPPMNSIDLAKMQKAEPTKNNIDFGKISTGFDAVQEIEIKNTGKQDLLIKKVYCNARYITTATEKRIIKPGGKTRIKVTYKAESLLGKDAKTLSVYTNDPLNPVIEIPVTAEVGKQ